MNRNRSIMLQIAVGAVALGAFGYLISVCTTALARRFLLALLCIAAFGAGCTAAGSLGPNITLTGDKGPIDMLRSGPSADGEATIRIEAGDDVGYYVAAWRNKSAPNLNTNLNGPLTPAPAKP